MAQSGGSVEKPPKPSGSRLRSVLFRFRKERSGATAVEFALLGGTFFLIVFSILETAFIFIAEMTLEQAVARASRTVRTGEVDTASMAEGEFREQLCGHITLLLTCDNVKFDLRGYDDFASIPTAPPISDAGALETSGFTFERGDPAEIMALRAFYEWPLYTDIVHRFLSDLDGGKHLVMSVAVFKTEPYQGGGT